MKDQIDVSAYFQLAIAEKHGDVEKTIRKLGGCLERRVEQQARLRGILVYPMILFVFLAAIFACMKLFLMPELKQFEASGGNETVFDWQIFFEMWDFGADFAFDRIFVQGILWMEQTKGFDKTPLVLRIAFDWQNLSTILLLLSLI